MRLAHEVHLFPAKKLSTFARQVHQNGKGEPLLQGAQARELLNVGTQLGQGSEKDELIQAIRSGSSDSIDQIGRQLVGRSIGIQPTLTVRPGFPVRVIVTRDLVLEPYTTGEAR